MYRLLSPGVSTVVPSQESRVVLGLSVGSEVCSVRVAVGTSDCPGLRPGEEYERVKKEVPLAPYGPYGPFVPRFHGGGRGVGSVGVPGRGSRVGREESRPL